ncbi:MAG: DUF4317 domain-containing protein [Lachnospiraceae bacterium]|nr:DUF4317 domain-containing protein [Lachnospiraceae bacterium]
MNRKEINEIKKLFSQENSCITRICGCFVDPDKNKKVEIKDAFLSLEEEARFKYFDIFKKTMSGTLGKNLINMEFPGEEEESEEGSQRFLMELLKSELKDETLIEKFYDKIIDTYDYAGNYYIILIHNSYDIPSITSDGMGIEDASDYVYQFLMCSICPIKPSKPGLCYNAVTNNIENSIRDMMVEAPMLGFVFPAFNDRNTDVHNLLYYSKNAEDISIAMTEAVLGCHVPLPAKEQKETFNLMIEESLGRECEFDTVKAIHNNLNELVAEKKDAPEPLVLDKTEVKGILASSGASMEHIESFEKEYDQTITRDTPIMATNVYNPRKFEIKTPDVTVNVNPERTDLVETRIIDGVPCLVIELNDAVAVNGIRCLAANPKENRETPETL